MAFSDRWTLIQLRLSCRLTLADPNARFWADDELNNYIDEWQQALQDKFEFVWGSSTTTTSLSTFTLATSTPTPLRLDAIYWNGIRLAGRSKQELDDVLRTWRQSTGTQLTPQVVYQNDSNTFSLWPPPGTGTTGVMVHEYPTTLTFASGTSTMQIPAWTRYSCRDYVAFKAYLREGPANSPTKAMRYHKRWERHMNRFGTIWANYFPGKYLRLKPAASYESRIILGQSNSSRVIDYV